MKRIFWLTALSGIASGMSMAGGTVPPISPSTSRAVWMGVGLATQVRLVMSIIPGLAAPDDAVDAWSREVSYSAFAPEVLPEDSTSREVTYYVFSVPVLTLDGWSREYAFGPPVPFEPQIASWSREVSYTQFNGTPVPDDSNSREFSYGPPPPFEPQVAAWSREVSYEKFDAESVASGDAWSREYSVKVTSALTGRLEFQDLAFPDLSPVFVEFSVRDASGTELGPFEIEVIDHQYRLTNLPRGPLRVSNTLTG